MEKKTDKLNSMLVVNRTKCQIYNEKIELVFLGILLILYVIQIKITILFYEQKFFNLQIVPKKMLLFSISATKNKFMQLKSFKDV